MDTIEENHSSGLAKLEVGPGLGGADTSLINQMAKLRLSPAVQGAVPSVSSHERSSASRKKVKDKKKLEMSQPFKFKASVIPHRDWKAERNGRIKKSHEMLRQIKLHEAETSSTIKELKEDVMSETSILESIKLKESLADERRHLRKCKKSRSWLEKKIIRDLRNTTRHGRWT